MEAATVSAIGDSVMAVAAVIALAWWRRPPVVASHHNLARRVAVLVVRFRRTAQFVAANSRTDYRGEDGPSAVEQLRLWVTELRDLHVEVEAELGYDFAASVLHLAEETQLMIQFIDPDGTRKRIDEFVFAMARLEKDKDCVEVETRLVALCDVIRDWTAHYIAPRNERVPETEVADRLRDIMGVVLREREDIAKAEADEARARAEAEKAAVARYSARDRGAE